MLHTAMARALTAVRNFFADGAIRYGLKFGLAGMLAVFLSLVVRLQEPTWALFTVYVLMIAHYVGAIAEKSIFRIIGTTVGGVLGYLITATFQQNPVIFLTLVGLVVGAATAMFGQSKYPYAFLLCALTMVVVVSNGMSDPDHSWWFMLLRIEEVSVGILSVIVVQSLLWPRFARVEFGQNVRSAFADLRNCFAESAPVIFDGHNAEAVRRAEGFPSRVTALRGLLDFGARESSYFRARLPTYSEIATCVSRIASAIVTLGRTLPSDSVYRQEVSGELRALHDRITASLDELSREDSTVDSRRARREALEDAVQALDRRLSDIRETEGMRGVDPRIAMSLGIHVTALLDLRDQIKRAHELLDSLPADPTQRSVETEPFAPPTPPPFWMKTGVKSAIAVVAALLIDNWAHIPGGTMFVLGAWVFTALDATSPGGQGDRRSFHYAAYNVAAMLALSLILIAARPMLSSYAVMNTVIFTWLFVWGYLTYSTRGMTIPMQLAMLASVGILALNGQRPIPFQSIMDFFLGIVLAQILSALIQRTLWPSLPQWEMRDRFIEFLRTCRAIVEQGPQSVPFWKRVRLALIPGETLQRIHVLREPLCPAGEPEQLEAYLHSLQRVGGHLLVTVGKLDPLIPKEHKPEASRLLRELEAEFNRQIDSHLAGLRKGDLATLDGGAIEDLLERWISWVGRLRIWMLEHGYEPIDVLRILGLSARYEEAGRDFIVARKQAAKLRLPLYIGDYAL